MPSGQKIPYSQSELAWLEARKLMPRRELTEQFNVAFCRSVSEQNIKALCQRNGWKTGRTGCIAKGDAPWNKGVTGYMGANATSFQKGQRVHNHKPVGYERTSKDGYIEIKTAEPRTFELKHRVVWRENGRELPNGSIIAFKNGIKTDCRIENLMLMTRNELARLNQSYIKLSTPETHLSCILMAKVKAKINEVNRD